MSRVLFVCGNYYPIPYANGICVMRLQEELKARGIESDVICSGENTSMRTSPFGDIYVVNKPAIRNVILRKLVRFCIWPINDFRIIDGYRKMIQKAVSENDYLCTVAVLRPMEGVLACAASGKYLIYECDSISNNGDNLYGIKHILKHRVLQIEQHIYDKADFIFHLNCHKRYYSGQRKYEKYAHKSCFVDIPHFSLNTREDMAVSAPEARDRVAITYLGSLSPKRNPPDYSIALLRQVAQKVDICCKYYSRGCDEAFNQVQCDDPKVFQAKGYVSQEALVSVKENTDIFLSIGFNYSGTVTSIPSKIFEYMRTGKPILHISGGANDTALPYLQEYGNALIVDPKKPENENVATVVEFLMNQRGKRIELDVLRQKFPMNTPEYTVDLLLRYIEQGRT